MRPIKLYVAGKVSKESIFQTHHWRDDFCTKIEELSGVKIDNLDPLKEQMKFSVEAIFAKDCQLINRADCVVVYLSDDISVGGSQEILIAKYLCKPVIGLAPTGGKFNGSTKVMLGEEIKDYKDPFVFSTCDVVCGSIEEVAKALQKISELTPKTMQIIDDALAWKDND